jgi:hypothetical protein
LKITRFERHPNGALVSNGAFSRQIFSAISAGRIFARAGRKNPPGWRASSFFFYNMLHRVPLRSNATRREQATLCCFFALSIFVTMLSEAQAQKPGTDRGKEAIVALQPFSLDEPAPVRVAYYAPRAVLRAEPVSEENEPEVIPQMEIDSARSARPIVAGSRAILRNGIAYAPSNAPANVKSAIWAANTLRGKRYLWGGGHGSFDDYGYDCSGTVSFALHHANLLEAPLPSSEFLRYGERGRGRWITIYARRGHTFAVIAGLRLDTTDLRYGGDVGPRWYVDGRNTHGFAARHPVGM